MARLRDPNGGCPWDLEQDFKSIAPYTIEEAYEVSDAIDRGDMNDLKEELGDLLLQPVYHAQMASEQNLFGINEVINAVTEKMISRHPHVFGDRKAEKASDVNKIWDERKGKEKARDSILDGIAKALPSLLRAHKLQAKAAKTGFEWKNPDGAFSKLEEEMDELRVAIENGNESERMDEFGDVLFALVNYGRMNNLDAETALRNACGKFEKRFRVLEKDINLKNASLDEMLEAWSAVKRKQA